MPSRRAFLTTAAAALVSSGTASAQVSATRLNVAEIDRGRILKAAGKALAQPPAPSPDLKSDAFLALTLNVPALAAACIVDPTQAQVYSRQAFAHLEAWFLNPKTRPTLELGENTYEPLIELAPLAETAVAIPFLALEPGQPERLKAAFAHYLTFLTEDRTALLARDSKTHHASGWLLQTAAFAHLTGNDAVLTEARHRFKTQTIRAQILADGTFPHEVTTEDPYRNSLFNLDLLAGACVLLSTRFDSVWDHELQDGPGMRAAVARHVPFIRDRASWPYPSDLTLFKDLPGRRPALLFAGRAYSQPEYAALWRTLDPDPANAEILRTFPIRQPVLWQPSTRATV